MNRRLRSLCLAAVTAATTITAVAAGTGSAAAATPTCKPVANIFTMQADGDLWNYRHSGPSDGGFSWAGAQQVGWGWGGKTFAGPDGWLFNITTGGELRRLRYNGGGWDTMPGGGQFQTIGWGWQAYVQAANRGKITVDAGGSIFTLEGDQVRWWSFDHAGGGWAPGSGRVLDVGWSRFDQITASGSGGLQARDISGVLHRFRYHRATGRFIAHDLGAAGWTNHSRLFSAGGDVYYAVRPDTGQLVWNRFGEHLDNGTWQSSGGSVIGHDWGTDVDITATTSDCSLAGLIEPPTWVRVTDENAVPPLVVTPASGGLHLVDTNFGNEIIDTHSTGPQWGTRVVAGRFSGVSGPVLDDEAGTAMIGATEFETGDVKLFTLEDGQWQAPLSLGGRMEWTPAAVRKPDGTLVVYAMGSLGEYHSTQRRNAYVTEQLPSGEFLAWRPYGDRHMNYYGAPEVISDGDETTIVLLTRETNEWFRHTPGSLPVRGGVLAPGGGRVVLTGDGQGGTIVVGHHLSNGKMEIGLLREKADRSGFEDTWELVGGPIPLGTEGAHPFAQVLPNGSVAVTVLGDFRRPLVTTSTVPGAREFGPWAVVAPDVEHVFTDAPSLGLTRSGDVVLTVRSGDQVHHWRASVPGDPTAPLQFTGGRIS